VCRAWTRAAIVATATVVSACAAGAFDTHDDLTLSTQVKIALIDDAQLGEFRINASTFHAVVTLQGTVPSQADLEHALAVARRVRGVKNVKSELKVSSSP
jgi:osmotically-inducible protein OsmY